MSWAMCSFERKGEVIEKVHCVTAQCSLKATEEE